MLFGFTVFDGKGDMWVFGVVPNGVWARDSSGERAAVCIESVRRDLRVW